MSEQDHDPQMLLEIYRLHAELAEQAAAGRESLNKLYSGMVASIIAASVLLHRVAPDSATMWVLPVVGMAVSVSWMMSFRSMTARLAAKHAVLVELEAHLPFEFLKRENEEFDRVLAPTKQKILEVQASYKDKIENLEPQLQRASGFAFYNTSRYDFERLLGDAPHIAANLRNYIAGFSPNMREVLEKFDFDNTISKLDEAGLLFQVKQPLRRRIPPGTTGWRMAS